VVAVYAVLTCCCSAGAGGDEAGIWAGDLLRMYQRYAQSQGWKASMINYTEADAGGYKEVVLQVRRWAVGRLHVGRLPKCQEPTTVTLCYVTRSTQQGLGTPLEANERLIWERALNKHNKISTLIIITNHLLLVLCRSMLAAQVAQYTFKCLLNHV
jgi:hypothetical protein